LHVSTEEIRMRRLVAIGILTCALGWAGPAVADECWQFDNFLTDFIRLSLKPDFDPKKVVTGFYQIDVTGHTGRVLLVGTYQPNTEVDGARGIALQGSILDPTFAGQPPNGPGGFQCWLHLKFASSFASGTAAGECVNYFVFGNEPITKVSCSAIPAPIQASAPSRAIAAVAPRPAPGRAPAN
jgi:hypothetical protein